MLDAMDVDGVQPFLLPMRLSVARVFLRARSQGPRPTHGAVFKPAPQIHNSSVLKYCPFSGLVPPPCARSCKDALSFGCGQQFSFARAATPPPQHIAKSIACAEIRKSSTRRHGNGKSTNGKLSETISPLCECNVIRTVAAVEPIRIVELATAREGVRLVSNSARCARGRRWGRRVAD